MAALKATGLVKRFEHTCAVDGVELELDPGEVRGLLGPNGAGKTTLLRILFGLVRPDAGSIELFGRRLTRPEAPALDRVGGFVEQPSFYPYLSGRANLELLAELDGDGADAAIDELLGRMALADRAGDRVGGYSSGMRQRLGIAAALLRAPRLLLLDEPTSGLDPAGARTLRALIGELAADGVAVLISSHQIGEVEEVCDSFTVLRRGKVVWDGSAGELRAQAPGSAYALDTSDDARALAIAARCPGVSASTGLGGGLALTVEHDCLDGFVLALADERVAVRRLELLVSPLESIFFALTAERPASEPVPVQPIPA